MATAKTTKSSAPKKSAAVNKEVVKPEIKKEENKMALEA